MKQQKQNKSEEKHIKSHNEINKQKQNEIKTKT